MTKYEKEILKRIDIFLKMFYSILIFAFDSSSYKSKTNNEIKETGSDSTWPNGDHNEDHFMFARFTSNSLTFEHTYHRMWTINVTIEDTW